MKRFKRFFPILLVLISFLTAACAEDPVDPQEALNDTTPPTVAVTAPIAGSTVGDNFFIKAEAQDPQSGVTQIYFYLNGEQVGNRVIGILGDAGMHTYTSDPVLISTLSNGTYTATAVAYNPKSFTATNSITFKVDKGTTPQKPVVVITAPVAGNVSNTIAIQADASVVGSTVSKVDFYLNGTLLSSDTVAPYVSGSIDTTSYTNMASLQLKAVATAANGLSSEQDITVSVLNNYQTNDTTAPALAITSHTDGATVSGSITIGASSSDAESGVDRVEFYFNGTLQSTATALPYQSVSLDTTTVSNGSHTVTVISYNGAGLSTTNEIGLSVNNQNLQTDYTLSLVNVADDYEHAQAPIQQVDVANPGIKWLNPVPVTGIVSYLIEVSTGDEEEVLWSVANVGGSLSAVTYGMVPAGGQQLFPQDSSAPEPLAPNSSYFVSIIATDNLESFDGNQIGVAHVNGQTSDFTPASRSAVVVRKRISRAAYRKLLDGLRK